MVDKHIERGASVYIRHQIADREAVPVQAVVLGDMKDGRLVVAVAVPRDKIYNTRSEADKG